ncbi:MAG: glycosyltransferase family 2 protein [Desulforhopalus sp.]
MPQLSIIVISYNTKEMTVACLRSVYEQTTGVSFELIVVDNNSRDGSAEAIVAFFPGVKLIPSKENLGFARANNLASKEARGRYLLLLNPDTIILEGAIQKLLAYAQKHPEGRVYGGRTLFGDRSLNPTSCWKSPSLWSLFCYASGLASLFRRNILFDPESYGKWKRDDVREVDIVTGCFLMIEKELWTTLGGFDTTFFMYGEDADLCMRARNKGARPVITPEATIVHYNGASEKVRADKMIRLFRAKEQLIQKHWRPITAKIGLYMLRISVLSRMLSCSILKHIYNTKFKERSEIWKEIWQRSKEWQTS